MLHTGTENYEVAAKRAGDWARKKLEKLIQDGAKRASETLVRIENQVIEDTVTPAKKVEFFDKDGRLMAGINDKEHALHSNAAAQIMAKTNGTKRVMDWALTPDTAPEFASIMNKKMAGLGSKRFLVRSVDGEARAFLSDRYRRLDVRPMVDALVTKAIHGHGAMALDAKMLDTSCHIKMLLPMIYEPVPNEVGVFGLTFRSSDFGAGKLWIKGFFNRLWCTNLCMTEDGISQVHLGRALSDDIQFSQHTYELDTRTMASAIGDVVDHIFSRKNIERRLAAIQTASSENDAVDVGKVLKQISGRSGAAGMSKEETSKVVEAYNSADVEMLPPGNTRWRLSNAISLIAQSAEDADRQLEMEALAGRVAGLVE